MVNESIVTSLKNAINKGESLQIAMQILVGSGYDPREVSEASKYVGQGVIHNFQANPTEIMPQNKDFLQNQQYQQPHQNFQQQPVIQQQPINQQQPKIQQTTNQQVNQQVISQQSKIQRKSQAKEIILVLILLFLMGVLAATIFLKDTILGYFS